MDFRVSETGRFVGDAGELASFEHEVMLNAITYSPGGRFLLFGTLAGGDVHLWAVQRQEVARTSAGLQTIIPAVALSLDSRYAARGDYNRNLAVWDFETSEMLLSTSYGNAVASLAFSPDGQYLLQSG
jgi:WD40 repeat protein